MHFKHNPSWIAQYVTKSIEWFFISWNGCVALTAASQVFNWSMNWTYVNLKGISTNFKRLWFPHNFPHFCVAMAIFVCFQKNTTSSSHANCSLWNKWDIGYWKLSLWVDLGNTQIVVSDKTTNAFSLYMFLISLLVYHKSKNFALNIFPKTNFCIEIFCTPEQVLKCFNTEVFMIKKSALSWTCVLHAIAQILL